MKSNTLLWVVVAGIVLIGGYYMMNQSSTTGSPSSTPTSTVVVQPATSANPAAMRPITIDLNQLNDLGQSGTATLSEDAAGKLVVTLALAGGTFTAPQPAHIHFGACPKPGDVKYPLTNVVNGQSVTTLAVSWADLVKAGESLAVNVHKSGAESKIYTACGNLPLK